MSLQPSRALAIAALAALCASFSDILMLRVAVSIQPLELSETSSPMLWLGAVLGIATIPFFALGYCAIARLLRGSSRRLAQGLTLIGAGMALTGTCLHGLTALSIASARLNQVVIADPARAAIMDSAWSLGLWSLATLLVVAASIMIWLGSRRYPALLAPQLGWLNPAALTIVGVLILLPWQSARILIIPAVPNLSHALFFFLAFLAYRHRAGGIQNPGD